MCLFSLKSNMASDPQPLPLVPSQARLTSSTPSLPLNENSLSSSHGSSSSCHESDDSSSCDTHSWPALATQALRHSISVPAFNLIVDPWIGWGKVIKGHKKCERAVQSLKSI